MLEDILSVLLAGPAWGVALKLVAVIAGFVLGVRLLAAGGRTADDRDRSVLDAVRRRRSN